MDPEAASHKALDLLSLGGDESSEKVKERLLTATILQSRTSHWKHKVEPTLTVNRRILLR